MKLTWALALIILATLCGFLVGSAASTLQSYTRTLMSLLQLPADHPPLVTDISLNEIPHKESWDGNWNVPKVKRCLVLSEKVYDDKCLDDEWFSEWTQTKRFPYGFSAYNSNRLWFVFRGTRLNEMTECWRDLKWYPQEMSVGKIPCRVHTGFADIWSECALSIGQTVANEHENRALEEIVLCGYSMGGALALLAACFLASAFPQRQFLVHTFGAPRCGDRGLQRVIEACAKNLSVWQMQNLDDLVPSLPPTTVPIFSTNESMQYTHAGHRMVFAADHAHLALNHSLQTYWDNVERCVQFD